MKAFFSKRKIMAAVTCLSLVALIVTGTFAWTSLTSQKVNEWRGSGISNGTGPGGSLHDDHDNESGTDSRKDVYVENWGDVPLLVRIKLSEYMEIGTNAGMVTIRDDKSLVRSAGNSSIPLYEESLVGDVINWMTHIPEDSVINCGKEFHKYWTWAMGGSKYYKPATEAQKEAARQTNESVITDNGNYTSGSQTLNCSVITIDEWLALPSATRNQNNYWYIDNNGWAYWSHYLAPGEATGLLLSRVNKTSEPISGRYYYAINVEAQMADYESPFVNTNVTTAEEALALIDAAPSTPTDFTNWITGTETEKASDEAIEALKFVFVEAIDDGLISDDFPDDQEILDVIVGEIFSLGE